MEFKINKKTRIKISIRVLGRFRNEDGSYINISKFAEDIGLKKTSRRGKGSERRYYFQVIDKEKYMLAKLKYEII